MITKIEKLKNIGNFEDYTASGDVTLKRMSIIYAENGAGKTTLSQVLHSLATNNPEIIKRHTRIGATETLRQPSTMILAISITSMVLGGTDHCRNWKCLTLTLLPTTYIQVLM